MSLAWWKGTITEEEMAEEHPAELEEIKKRQSEKSDKFDDLDSPVEDPDVENQKES